MLRLHALRPGPVPLMESPSRGSEDLPEVQLLGAPATKIATKMTEAIAVLVAWAAQVADLLRGRVIVENAILTTKEVTATTVVTRTTVLMGLELQLHLERRRGSKLLLLLPERSPTEATPVQVLTQDTQRCPPLLVSEARHHHLLTT